MRMLVNIDVPELTPAIGFYTAALGLQLNRTMDEDVAELVGGSSVIYLLRKPAETETSSRPTDRPERRRYSRHWTPVHVDFVVDDIADATERALAAGASRESECIEWNGSKCITFADPFGHGFCLIEFDKETYGPGEAQPE